MSLLSGDLGYTTWLEVERTFRIYDLESRIFQEQSRADGLLRLVQESSVVVSSSSFSVVVAFWFLMPSSFASMNLLRSGAIGTDLEHLVAYSGTTFGINEIKTTHSRRSWFSSNSLRL